jgi:large subunit ribosomal protein L35
MPKIKTNKGASKRFKRTGSGRLMRNRAFASHIMTKKSRKRKRNLRKPTLVDATERKKVARLLPNISA